MFLMNTAPTDDFFRSRLDQILGSDYYRFISGVASSRSQILGPEICLKEVTLKPLEFPANYQSFAADLPPIVLPGLATASRCRSASSAPKGKNWALPARRW